MKNFFTQNMTSIDSNIRYVLSVILILLAYYFSSFILLLIALVFLTTAYTRFCSLYPILNINNRFSQNNYFQTLLPKNNPEPTFIFNDKGDIQYRNDAAKNQLPEIQNIQELGCQDIERVFEVEMMPTIEFEKDEKIYQVKFKGIKEENLIVGYASDITELMQLQNDIEQVQKDVIYKMGEIAESRSKETGNHVRRVANYSYLLATLYGLSENEAEILKVVSPMHDIGKVATPDEVLNKPGKLTPEEWTIMKRHAQLGYEMLNGSDKPIIQAAAIVAYTHHEKYNGNGYPNGLSGEDIHIYGRITAIADVFDALGSERVYKNAWELDDILELFRVERGEHFDPKLVDLFFENLEQFLEIRDKFQD